MRYTRRVELLVELIDVAGGNARISTAEQSEDRIANLGGLFQRAAISAGYRTAQSSIEGN